MEHEYEKRLAMAAENGCEVCQPGTNQVWYVRVEHDDGCGIYAGKLCDCDPNISASESTLGIRFEIYNHGKFKIQQIN